MRIITVAGALLLASCTSSSPLAPWLGEWSVATNSSALLCDDPPGTEPVTDFYRRTWTFVEEGEALAVPGPCRLHLRATSTTATFSGFCEVVSTDGHRGIADTVAGSLRRDGDLFFGNLEREIVYDDGVCVRVVETFEGSRL